jgi:hypothetical protein
MQRNFEPMRKQVEAWKGTRLPDETAKLVIYRAFVEGKLAARNTRPGAFTTSISTVVSRSLLRKPFGV